MPIASPPTVTSREEARRELLAKQKRLTKLRDEPNADRRRLPMIRRRRQRAPARARLRQLLLRGRRHPGASAATARANTMLVAVTRARNDTLASFRERIGWTFPWYSSWGSDHNYDFHASIDERVAPVPIFYRTQPELAAAGMPYTPSLRDDSPGISAFLRVGDEVFHTYSAFRRGERLALAASPPPRAAPDPRTMSSTLTASLSSQRF